MDITIICLFIGIIIMGAILIIIPICRLVQRGNIRKNGENINAVVVKTVLHYYGENSSYHPVFRYFIGGHVYEVEYKIGAANPKFYDEGDFVEIIYSRKNPKKIIVGNDINVSRVIIFSIFMGIVLLVLGLYPIITIITKQIGG